MKRLIIAMLLLLLVLNVSTAYARKRGALVKLKKEASGEMKSHVTHGKTYADPSTGMEFVLVKGGCFEMGDASGVGNSDERPVHRVCVNDFYIGKYEVTQGQWQKIMGNNPSYFKNCGNNCPVETVSWNTAQDFISRLSQQSGKKYRLPTEAEWEYAARSGGQKEKWPGTGNESEIGQYAWYRPNSESKIHPVGQKKPNGAGLYDMGGNVNEWVADLYDGKYYQASPQDNPQGPGNNSTGRRSFRGGSGISDPRFLRASSRFSLPSDLKDNGSGFRLALPLLSDAGAANENVKTEVKAESVKPAGNAGAAAGANKSIEFKDPLTGMEFVFVKGGCFDMGDAFGDVPGAEKPHKVCVKDFYIGKYEVTQGQWQKIARGNPSHFRACGENCPVENITSGYVQEFINRLNQKTRKQYRVPTEAEWEYAARSGGKSEKWAGTGTEAELGEYAWYGSNSGYKPHPVGQKKPNGLGIYDMNGNVWELVADRYDMEYFQNSPKYHPKGSMSTDRSLRGGSWKDDAKNVRTSRWLFCRPDLRGDSYGVRLALPAQ